MEMMQAPTPFIEGKDPSNIININDLKIKEVYKFEGYDLAIGLLEGNIIFICSKKEIIYQASKNYDSITEKIPNFKSCSNINSIYNLMVQLFASNRYEIKKDNESKLKIVIKLKDILGNDETHEILLYRKELDVNTKMNLMEERIKILEKKVDEINELKKGINALFNENKILKEEINKLKSDKINQLNDPNIESKIFKKRDDIKFILNRIEKMIGSINNIKLIYRGTRDDDSVNQFHSKCDNIQNTLMIVQTTAGYKFGGFTSTGWNNEKGKCIYDNKAFCFSINLNKIYDIAVPERALYKQTLDGSPSFGFSPYAFIIHNMFLKSDNNFTEKMIHYKGEAKAHEINGGNRNFKVDELEVFQIL